MVNVVLRQVLTASLVPSQRYGKFSTMSLKRENISVGSSLSLVCYKSFLMAELQLLCKKTVFSKLKSTIKVYYMFSSVPHVNIMFLDTNTSFIRKKNSHYIYHLSHTIFTT